MPICDECGETWRPDGRRFMDGRKVLCTECYVKIRKERDEFNGH